MDVETKKLALQTLNRLDGNLKTLRSILGDTPQTGPSTGQNDLKSNQKDQATSEFGEKEKPEKKPKAKGINKFFASSLPADELGETPDITSEDWPIAIDPALIVPSEGDSEKQYRALQIVGLFNFQLEKKNILDCGCGEGYNSREMANVAEKVVGYDINQDDHWPDRAKENLFLTNDKELVAEHAPYHFIVLYDVIDHLQGEDPEVFMQWVSSVLHEHGQIFVRAHPWTSKTGGHFYETVNKAWVHLALTTDELIKAGMKATEPNVRAVRPMAAYEEWFKSAGLTVKSKQVKADYVDNFFMNSGLLDRIIKVTWGGEIEAETAKMIMSNSWIDYLLKKN